MFQIDDDMTIYITRGDVAYFSVTADNNGVPYKFKPGDVVRIKVFAKKDATNVVLQKDFPITVEVDHVNIYLEEKDTKIGEVISKPVDYWYEVELNPFTNPQTIVGYDDDGAKIFRLFPEGRDLTSTITEEDIPLVDDELSLTSERPVQNQAVTRALVRLEKDCEHLHEVIEKSVDEWFAESEEKLEEDVDNWMTEHPEVTTTVQDGSLDVNKFTNDAKPYILNNFVTPQMYGAKGDGVTDDTEAIQTALSENDTIMFPDGVYLITDSLLLTKDNQTIIGFSHKTIIKTNNEAPIFKVEKEHMNCFTLSNITLNGGRYGLYDDTPEYFERGRFVNVNFENQTECGVFFSPQTRCGITYFEDCVFRYCNGGVFLTGDNNNIVKFLKCRFEGLNDNSILIDNQSVTYTDQPSGVDIAIVDCRFEAHDHTLNNAYSPIYLDGCFDVTIERNYFEDVKSPAITMDGNRLVCRHIDIRRNHFFNDTTSLGSENIVLKLDGNINAVSFTYNYCSFGNNPKIVGHLGVNDFELYNNGFLSGVEGFADTSFNYNDMGYANNHSMPIVIGSVNGIPNKIFNSGTKFVFAPYNNNRVIVGESVGVLTPDAGVILTDTVGIPWRISVSTSGQLTITKVTDYT